MTQHTKGPWVVNDTKNQTVCNNTVSCAAGYVVARTFNNPSAHVKYEDLWAESEANARLVAAAPDLLEAVANLIGHCRFVATNFDVHYAHLHEAEAAFSKATA